MKFLSSLLILVFLIASALIFFNYLIPQYRINLQNAKEITQLKTTLSLVEKINAQAKKSKKILAQAIQNPQNLNLFIPQNFDPEETNYIVFQILNRFGIQIESVDFEKAEPILISPSFFKIQRYQFQVGFQTDYQTLKQILNAFENSVRLFTVQQISIQKKENNQLNVSLQLTTYSLVK